jgi:thiosulfate dehydrogenase [quinone] large subunit
MEQNKTQHVLGVLRIVMGFIFLWAFVDKLFGLGFATAPDKSWLSGISPTTGFLQFGVHGPFTVFFQGLAGSPLVDWLFMLGLLFVGISLMLGIFMRLSGFAGIVMLLLMYLAVGLSPANNPVIDEHIVYILVIMILVMTDSGKCFGLRDWWENTLFVQKYKVFK